MTIRVPYWFARGFTPFPWLVILRKDADATTVEHEAVHQQQQRQDGWLRFVWRYITSRKWRARYETDAYVVDVVHMQREDPHTRLMSIVRAYAEAIHNPKAFPLAWYEDRLYTGAKDMLP